MARAEELNKIAEKLDIFYSLELDLGLFEPWETIREKIPEELLNVIEANFGQKQAILEFLENQDQETIEKIKNIIDSEFLDQ